MSSASDSSSPPARGLDARLVIDAIPALAWSSHPDGAVEFVNQKWHDYTGLSPEESYGCGWKAAVHSEDLSVMLANWGRSSDLEVSRESKVRLRRSDGAFHWFLLRREPLYDETGAVVRWFGAGIDVEEGSQKEMLRVAEKRTLELIADGASLSRVLNELCAAIDEYASATSQVLLMDRAGHQLLPLAGPNFPQAVTAALAPWPVGPNWGCCGTAAAPRRIRRTRRRRCS